MSDKYCMLNPVTQVCFPVKAPSCTAPLFPKCDQAQVCVCLTPPPGCQFDVTRNMLVCTSQPPANPPAPACTLTIGYTDPAAPALATPAGACDDAGVELAVAVILAKLLGAR
jgi:hypothetical protein